MRRKRADKIGRTVIAGRVCGWLKGGGWNERNGKKGKERLMGKGEGGSEYLSRQNMI